MTCGCWLKVFTKGMAVSSLIYTSVNISSSGTVELISASNCQLISTASKVDSFMLKVAANIGPHE